MVFGRQIFPVWTGLYATASAIKLLMSFKRSIFVLVIEAEEARLA